MIEEHQVTALIPARGGSKGVPRKNMRSLGGKPLVAWPIDIAKEVSAIDRIVVSTDDENIAACAEEHAAEVEWRPKKLATDDALVIDAIRHHLDLWKQRGTEVSILVLLEPTCPFRSVGDVERSLNMLVQANCDSVATFCEAEVNPWRTWRVNEEGKVETFVEEADPWSPRQELPEAHQLNGAVYAFFAERLPRKHKGILFGQLKGITMPKERSIDIDTEIDLLVANQILSKKSEK